MNDNVRSLHRYLDELELLVTRVKNALPLMDHNPDIAREQIQEQLDRVLHFGESQAPSKDGKP